MGLMSYLATVSWIFRTQKQFNNTALHYLEKYSIFLMPNDTSGGGCFEIESVQGNLQLGHWAQN